MASKKKAATVTAVETAAKADSAVKKIETPKGQIVVIPGVRTERLTTLLLGTAPLIVHAFSEKARLKIRAKHEGQASAGREPKDCIQNFENARLCRPYLSFALTRPTGIEKAIPLLLGRSNDARQ
jgi:hypothetical protein